MAKKKCKRCDSVINSLGFCVDVTCPFSDHKQTCPTGWVGHPARKEILVKEGLRLSDKCSCRLRVKRAKDYTCFEYSAYLDRRDKVLDKKPEGCPYDIGDVVVVEETQAVGVVLGCICEDGDLRTDVDGMRCWSSPGYLRFATVEDIRTLRCSDKLKKEFRSDS